MRMSKWPVVLLVTASGCRFLLGDGPDDNGADAGADMMVMADANTDPKCGWGTALPQGGICLSDLPASSPTIPSAIDTDQSSLCVAYSKGGGTYCVISGIDIAVPNLRVTGSKPLVVIATGTLTVNGTLDISSHTAVPSRGAGSDPANGCNYGTGPNGGGNPETRGAGGGSFGGLGGFGGLRNGQPYDPTSGKPGDPIVLAPPALLRGGCRGQDGNLAPITPGGYGGGAIYLVAGGTIDIGASAAINASGAGGGGGALLRGGGGGGSGGTIVLEAPTVNVLGRVFADGGGGGEGGGNNQPGNYGYESDGTSAAQGGTAGTSGGSDGGNGSYGSSLVGVVGGNDGIDSGGGGGGGAGIIWIRAQGGTRSGVVSPTPTSI